MPPIDRLLSQYSDPIRSWPGEEDLDAEARSNYAAANPTPRLQRPEEVWRGSVLPIAEMKDKGSPNPSDWRSSGDVLKHLDQGSRWAVPGVIQDVMDAAHAIYDTSGWGLGPATRFSTLPESERQRIAELGLAGATAGVTGGLTRAAVAPRLPGGVTELGIFGGRKARTADLEALARAEEMDAAGVPRESIWSDTGWFKGVDGKWRFEIDDSGMKPVVNMRDWINRKDGVTMAPHIGAAVQKAAENLTPEAPVRVKRLYEHGELDRAYPVGFTSTPEHSGIMGVPVQLIEGGNVSGIYMPEGWKGKPSIGVHETLPPGPARDTLIHELQHAIQEKEGFHGGGNQLLGREYLRAAWDRDADRISQSIREMEGSHPTEFAAFRRKNAAEAMKDWDAAIAAESDLMATEAGRKLADLDWQRLTLYKREPTKDEAHAAYKALAGEVEAVTSSKRAKLTPEERRSRPPWLDYDVPESDQIVRFGSRN